MSKRVIRISLALLAIATPAFAQTADHPPEDLTIPQPSDPPSAKCANLAPDAAVRPVSLQRTFLDDFDNSTLSETLWQTHYPGDGSKLNQRTMPNSKEQEIYVDPYYSGSGLAPLDLNPFSLKNGILGINVERTPASMLSRLYNKPFTSGIITTHSSLRQAYGYFEIRARLPHGKLLWPTFWLVRPNWEWPPEIDIMEAMDGDHPDHVTLTTHWKENGTGGHQMSWCNITVPNDDKEFHTFGGLWTRERIVYYVDRKPVAQLATPPGLDRPMYMIANVAVEGGDTKNTPASAKFDIDWITAYQIKADSAP